MTNSIKFFSTSEPNSQQSSLGIILHTSKSYQNVRDGDKSNLTCMKSDSKLESLTHFVFNICHRNHRRNCKNITYYTSVKRFAYSVGDNVGGKVMFVTFRKLPFLDDKVGDFSRYVGNFLM